MRNLLILTVAALALTACGKPPADSAYLNRGGPESLLDVSSEVVSLNGTNRAELKELSNWIEKDQPTRAEIFAWSGYGEAGPARAVPVQMELMKEAA